MTAHTEELVTSQDLGVVVRGPWTSAANVGPIRVLFVDDDQLLREATGPILTEQGYEVAFAENGDEALRRLCSEPLPDIILLDLKMPVMDGWKFRAIQKDDPVLGRIPVVTVSADWSAQAAAISAQASLHKPLDSKELLTTLERVLFEAARQRLTHVNDTERLTSLGRLAANVGHEINNPLAFVMANLDLSLEALKAQPRTLQTAAAHYSPEVALHELEDRLGLVREMLEDCRVGSERIRETVGNLQRLSRRDEGRRGALDLKKLIEQSISVAWNQIRHRACLVKEFEPTALPLISGNSGALGQVFLNLLVNAAQAIPEGNAETNEIRISTRIQADPKGDEIVVEISDTGSGIAPELVSRVFEPFFTTKPVGQGTGLGLSISRQTVVDHGGRITVDSEVGKGTTFRIFLPVASSHAITSADGSSADASALARGRVLVVDDEPSIGRVIELALKKEHDVVVVQRASDAITRLEEGQKFDLILCDVVMPEVSGPQFYATVTERWPALVKRLIFTTGGAFTPGTVEFLERLPTPVLSKPFDFDKIKYLIRQSVEQRQ